jgi:hypothetical protein
MLSCFKCPALKNFPVAVDDMVELKELDLRAPKKQVCKIDEEKIDILKSRRCVVRGGVVKKGKKGKKGRPSTS